MKAQKRQSLKHPQAFPRTELNRTRIKKKEKRKEKETELELVKTAPGGDQSKVPGSFGAELIPSSLKSNRSRKISVCKSTVLPMLQD